MTVSLIDLFQRAITYLRVSVTDRCDFRCVYCMSENMTFLPKKELLTLEELDRMCSAFIGMGVEKLRITGGEPLVRRGIMNFFNGMTRHLDSSGALKELTLTTNGSQLGKYALIYTRLGCGVLISWIRWMSKNLQISHDGGVCRTAMRGLMPPRVRGFG